MKVISLSVLAALALAAPASADLKAGAASSDITPPIGTPMFAYTARSNTPVGESDPQALFGRYLLDPETPKDPAAAHAASIDPLMTVIRVDTPDGKPIALWSNFAVHPTSFGDSNLLFSGDNAGVAERLVERDIAGATGTAP